MEGEPEETHLRGGKRGVHPRDADIAAVAGRQHGAVSAQQLIGMGLTPRAIEARLACGRLHRLHRGVYAVGHRSLTVRGWRMAAALRGGPGTVISHRAAGSEWGLRRWNGKPSITVPKWRPPNDRIEMHSSALPADERTVLDGIPITSVPRTLLDLATILDADALLRAVNEAEVRRLADPLSLPALLERHRGERGTGALRRVLESAGYGRGITREMLEELFAKLVGRYRLPHPELNAPIHVGDRFFEADCLWREQRLIVELQGARFHGTAAAMARDAERARRLLLAGWQIVPVTWSQLSSRASADRLARDLMRLLIGAAG